MHRQADQPALLGDGARDRLAYPPGRVGRKAVAARVIKFLDRTHQADVALLHEIHKRERATKILFRDAYNQPEIGLDQATARLVAARDCALKRDALAPAQYLLALQGCLRRQPIDNIL